MAPKQRNAAAAQAATAASRPTASPASPAAATPAAAAAAPPPSASFKPGHVGGVQTWDKIAGNVVAHYLDTTPQRTRLLDAFMAFLVAVGALQFVYCVLAGNYVRPRHRSRFFVYSG